MKVISRKIVFMEKALFIIVMGINMLEIGLMMKKMVLEYIIIIKVGIDMKANLKMIMEKEKEFFIIVTEIGMKGSLKMENLLENILNIVQMEM